MKKVASYVFLLLIPISTVIAMPQISLPVAMMRNTFQIISDDSFSGTVFILMHPFSRGKDTNDYAVLFTAAHVVDSMKEDSATIKARFQNNDGYQKKDYRLSIRDKGKPRWVKHPEVDIAAMVVDLPEIILKELVLIPTDLIADDQNLKDCNIEPGEKVFILGYPLGFEANDYGFPILRTGYIASYPLFPAKKERRILIDFKIFKGNSGGPVFCIKENPWKEDKLIKGTITAQLLLGIVIEDRGISEKIEYLDGAMEKRRYPLDIAAIVPATFMKELLDSLFSQ